MPRNTPKHSTEIQQQQQQVAVTMKTSANATKKGHDEPETLPTVVSGRWFPPNDNDDDDDDEEEEEEESSVYGDSDDDHDQIDPTKATNHRVQAAMAEKLNLARARENRVVVQLRIYFLLFLGLTAGLVGWGTYKYTRNVEWDDFETRFASIAGSVSDSFHDAVERKLGALDAMSVTITSHARESGQVFPTVTLPDFETRGANTRILADGVYVFWLPYVVEDKRAQWEAYAYQHYTHLYGAFGTETLLRTLQDQSFGIVNGEQQQQPNQNQRMLMTDTGNEAIVDPLGDTFDARRRLQDGAFQNYIPTIWNFQVRWCPNQIKLVLIVMYLILSIIVHHRAHNRREVAHSFHSGK